jgi:uncharacterized protein
VTISIDGFETSQDLHRRFQGGAPTFDTVFRNVKRFTEAFWVKRPLFAPSARMTLTHSTVHFLKDNYVRLWDELKVPIVWARDVDWLDREDDLALVPEDYRLIESQYALLRDAIEKRVLDRGINSLAMQLHYDLARIHNRTKRSRACAAGDAAVSIAVDGTISVCYHLADMPSYVMGTVQNGIADSFDHSPFIRRSVHSIPECRECSYKYLCSTGCLAKGIPSGISVSECYRGQCAFNRIYHEHCVKLYARLMCLEAAPNLAAILET